MEQIDASGQSMTIIHYVFQVGPERIACMPNMTEFHSTAYHPSYARSNHTLAVTCPACKKTEHWKAARARNA